MDNENRNDIDEAIIKDNEPTEGGERELLIFGEGEDSRKNKGVKYTKTRPFYIVITLMIGLAVGFIAAYLFISAKMGGAVKTDGYDVSLITELLRRIEEVHFGETPTSDELIIKAAHGLVDGMEDPYAEYYTDEEYNSYSASFNGNYFGIGILVQNPDGSGALIRRVYEDSFAEKAGLMARDVIIAVDGEDVRAVSGSELVAKITGEEGSFVSITFLRDGTERTVNVMRGEIYVKRVETMELEGGIGYLYLSSFSGNAVSEFREALNNFKSKGIEKLIVDLRDDPGGSLNIVIDICDMLLPECTVCSMQGRTTNPTKYFYSDADMFDFDLVVLVNGYSASASEIFAGAMQDNHRAKIIGTQTYGKGVVQTTFNLNGEHGYLKLTTDAYYTPNGTNLGGTGITPDIVVDLPEELAYNDVYSLYTEHLNEDTQIQAGIKELTAK